MEMRKAWISGEGKPWPLPGIFLRLTGLSSVLPVGKQIKALEREPPNRMSRSTTKLSGLQGGKITMKNYNSFERLAPHL